MNKLIKLNVSYFRDCLSEGDEVRLMRDRNGITYLHEKAHWDKNSRTFLPFDQGRQDEAAKAWKDGSRWRGNALAAQDVYTTLCTVNGRVSAIRFAHKNTLPLLERGGFFVSFSGKYRSIHEQSRLFTPDRFEKINTDLRYYKIGESS